jgi:hypothetical protein
MGSNISCPERGSHTLLADSHTLLPGRHPASRWLFTFAVASAVSLTPPSLVQAQSPDAGAPRHRTLGAHGQDISSFALPGPRVLDAETRARLVDQRASLRFDASGAEQARSRASLATAPDVNAAEVMPEPERPRRARRAASSAASRRLRAFELEGVTVLSNRGDVAPEPLPAAERMGPTPVALRAPGETIVERPRLTTQSIKALRSSVTEPRPSSNGSALVNIALGLCAAVVVLGAALWFKLRH